MDKASKCDLYELLEVVNTTNDMDLQHKLFSLLAAYLIKTDFHNEIIIKCRLLYDTLHDHLSKGSPLNMGTILNFVIALVSVKEYQTDKCKSLSMYAQNMLRTSGCLATICNLFTCTMDTWMVLCHCLTVACQGSEINQSYCSHLVSLCIPKCKHGGMEIFALLQSLLNNNKRNTELFLESGGLSIFTREFLQMGKCMELLNSVILTSPQAAILVRSGEIVKHLRHFLEACGPYSKNLNFVSQIGQWSSIILYHLNVPTKEIGRHNTPPTIPMSVSGGEASMEVENSILQPPATQPNADDTAELMQNVIREVMQWNTSKKATNSNTKGNYFNQNIRPSEKPPQKRYAQNMYSAGKPSARVKDVSFSSLFSHGTALMTTRNTTQDKINIDKSSAKKDVTTQTNLCSTVYHSLHYESKMNESIIIFEPAFASTPKTSKLHKEKIRNNFTMSSKLHKEKIRSNSFTMLSLSRTTRTTRRNIKTAHRVPRVKKQKCDKTVSPIKELNKTLGSKLFSAMNDSCTFLVNSVRNIFKVKKPTTEKNINQTSTTCDYSFTNYMNKRDEMSNEQFSHSEPENSDLGVDKNYTNTCKTCNDTSELKHKLDKDERLKLTVKKLKCGINLYGYDFKKISRVMWPRDSYMTPQVLYNLYRKLLVK